MENYVSQQLGALGISVALGAGGGLVYDLLRSLRLLDQKDLQLTHFLDGVFVLSEGVALLYLMLQLGEGTLRLYMLAGAALGTLLWFSLLSKWLRPVWSFWAQTLAFFAALVWRPVVLAAGAAKKGFSFARKYATIGMERIRSSGHTGCTEEEGSNMAETTSRRNRPKKAGKKRPSFVVLLVVFVLIAALGVEIIRVYSKLNTARQDEETLQAQLSDQQQANDALESDLSRKDDETFWKALARDLLGLAEEGERIFYDVNE